MVDGVGEGRWLQVEKYGVIIHPPLLPPLPSLTSPPQQEDYELVIDDQIAFVMAERVAGHREEQEVGGAVVVYFLF